MFAARVARLGDQQRPEKAGWAAPVRVAESRDYNRRSLITARPTRPRQRRTFHSRSLDVKKRENADELSVPLAVRVQRRFEGILRACEDLLSVHHCVARLFTICQKRFGRLRGRSPTVHDLSHADVLIAQLRARRISGIKGNDFHGVSSARDGSTWRHDRVRYFPYGEWDRCSGDES